MAAILDHLRVRAPESGPPRVDLVGGDAGMGKTRLLTEVGGAAEEAGWRVLAGHCLDFSASALPYLPFSEMVGRLADREPDLFEELTRTHPALTALAPGRRIRTPGFQRTEDLDRGEIFDGVHAGFETLAALQPLLLVVEDLHWADQSTRDLLSFLFVRAFGSPVAVVGSYRSDDLGRRHPLRPLLAEWVRLPGVERVDLSPLGAPDVRRLVRALHGGPVRERDVNRVVTLADGNPFYVEELVGAHDSGGTSTIPEDLLDLLLVRLDRLDDDARTVVRAASCSGWRVNHRLLTAVTGLGDAALDRAVRGALDAHVLVRDGDYYRFRHALLAEAVHDDLLPGEHQRLHAAYVKALEEGVVPSTAAELARHAQSAHDIPTAIRAGIEAGEEAMAVGGPDDAARHFEAVLDIVSRHDQPLPDDVDYAVLVARTADAITASGQPARAVRLVEEHLDRAPADLPDVERARLLMAWANCALSNEVFDESSTATAQALDLVGEEPSRLRARALSLHARWLSATDHDDEAVELAGEAMAMAQRFDLASVVAEATTTLARIDERSGDLDSALAALEEVAESAAADHDTVGEMRGRYHLAYVRLETGDLAGAAEQFRLTAEAAERAGRPWAPYGFDARFHWALTRYVRGDWDGALEVADVTGQTPPLHAESLLACVAMLVRAGRGDLDALSYAEPVKAAWSGEGMTAVLAGSATIDLHGLRRDLPAVWRTYDDVVGVLSEIWNPHFQASVMLAALVAGQVATEVARASTAERAGLLERVDDLQSEVDEVLRRTVSRPLGWGPEGQAWTARFRAEALRGRWLAGVRVPAEDELVAAWTETVAAFEAFGHPYEVARSQARLAAVLTATGRPGAREAAEAARETATRLGATPLVDELGVTARPAKPARHRGPASTELTVREREILGLVAQGRTNGEIGKQLFISTKTVSVHVSNILAKLGAGSRTEAAAVGRDRGLLG
ncbi:helix-turn-helix transcriptional regulator [Nocardioides marmoribigeumensis]